VLAEGCDLHGAGDAARSTSIRLMSDARRKIHSALVWRPPSAISGEQIGMVSSPASLT
jgi:hypothetical protein